MRRYLAYPAVKVSLLCLALLVIFPGHSWDRWPVLNSILWLGTAAAVPVALLQAHRDIKNQ